MSKVSTVDLQNVKTKANFCFYCSWKAQAESAKLHSTSEVNVNQINGLTSVMQNFFRSAAFILLVASSATADQSVLEKSELKECLVFYFNGTFPKSLGDAYHFVTTKTHRFEFGRNSIEETDEHYRLLISPANMTILISKSLVEEQTNNRIYPKVKFILSKKYSDKEQVLLEHNNSIMDYEITGEYMSSNSSFDVDMRKPLIRGRDGKEFYQKMRISCSMDFSADLEQQD